MQDGAVVDKKEPIERSEALEDPEAAARLFIEPPEAEKIQGIYIKSTVESYNRQAAEKLTRLSRLKKPSPN